MKVGELPRNDVGKMFKVVVTEIQFVQTVRVRGNPERIQRRKISLGPIDLHLRKHKTHRTLSQN